MIYKRQDEAVTDSDEERTIRGFKVAHVFDVSQTDGKDLPAFAEAHGDATACLAKLEEVVRSESIVLEYKSLAGGTLGASKGGKIVICPQVSDAEKFSILCHELAHEKLHWGARKHETSKIVRETEAEAVAFTVCRAMGIDSTAKSADYIQLYSGDIEVLGESLDFIQKTAASIIEGLKADSEQEAAAA
jgi:antirestriction protein ArdC